MKQEEKRIKKRVGLITFHASHNNGSMLQALALQNMLKKYGCEVEIIDFSNEGQRNLYAPLPKAHNWKQVIKRAIWRTNYKELLKQYESYEAFSKKYFYLTEKKYYNSSELYELNEKYDAFIVGSDQVWNIKCIDADEAYFLTFVKDKPVFAYAVSFGANNAFAPEENGKYVKYFEKFCKVSVREKNAQKWTLEATGKKVPICLDPTMLYSESEWEQMVDIGNEPIINGKYIFYYCFGINEEIQKFLQWAGSGREKLCWQGYFYHFYFCSVWRFLCRKNRNIFPRLPCPTAVSSPCRISPPRRCRTICGSILPGSRT